MFDKDELNSLYRYALSLSKQEDSAYDLLQSALEKWCKNSTLSIDKPLAYLKTIIRNLYIDIERRNKIIPMISIETSDVSYIECIDDVPLEDILMNQQEVQQLLASLNAEDNELLYLWAVEEYTADEISKIYNKPRGTILSAIHRLKKRIRKHAESVDLATERYKR